MVGRSAVGALTSKGYLMRLPPTVSRDMFFSNLSGLYATTILPYVTSFRLSGGISDFGMKKMVLVPAMSRMPCERRPSSFASDLIHCSLRSGFLMRSQYSNFSPVS